MKSELKKTLKDKFNQLALVSNELLKMNNLVEFYSPSIKRMRPASLEKLSELQDKSNLLENEIEDLAKKIYS